MPKIFISYRRNDSSYPADSIYKALASVFGKEALVFDVDTIPLGVDFRVHLSGEVARCDVLLAVIGDNWLDARNEAGERRLDDPNDFVRIEIEAALSRRIPVIPVLVGRAKMPKEEQLPTTLAILVYRNATEVRPGRDLDDHLERLVGGVASVLGYTLSKEAPASQDRQTEAEQGKRAIRNTLESLSDWQRWFLLRFIVEGRRQIPDFEVGDFKAAWDFEMDVLIAKGIVRQYRGGVYEIVPTYYEYLKKNWNPQAGTLA
jgi:hypothetical protein